MSQSWKAEENVKIDGNKNNDSWFARLKQDQFQACQVQAIHDSVLGQTSSTNMGRQQLKL